MEGVGNPRSGRGPLVLLVTAGLALSAVMVARSQVGGDQLNLLARGWLLASRGELVPYGNPTSTGGVEPGAVTSLLVALPLVLWPDHRAPTVLILLCHLGAYLLLDRVVHEVLGERGRWLFCVLYWLNPWRLYHGAFLWNPNFLFLAGAVHTWSAFRLRRSPRAGPSFLHGLAVLVAAQLHPAALILALTSIALTLRGRLRPHWAGLAAGVLAGSLTLVPWLLAVPEDPALLPGGGGEGFPARGLVLVFPVLKGLLYWLRYPSLFLPGQAMTFDFLGLGGTLGRALETGLAVVFGAAGVAGVAIAALANLRLWRRLRRRPAPRGGGSRWNPVRRPSQVPDAPGRGWLRAYTGWTLAASLGTFALAPTTPQPWQALIVLHVAVMPLVLLGDALLRSPRHRRAARTVILAQAALGLLLALATAFASPHYRCGGRDGLRLALCHDSPMLRELNVQATCRLPVRRPGGWWPDVLPPRKPESGEAWLAFRSRPKDLASARIPST